MKVGINMQQRWKQMKRWKKWILSISALVSVFIFAISFYLYNVIIQVDLNDIQMRLEERKQISEYSSDQNKLPTIIGNTVDKAESLTTKSIDTQDALDVASILLKSGLSIKEMYYLTGKSTDKLSNEEKQKIRDLLLKKLTPEEIKALRAITYDYGKGLNILDPNFPIELIGVYDEAEYARIKKELEERKLQALAASTTPNRSPSPVGGSGSPTPLPTPSATVATNEAPGSDQAAIRATYQGKLDTLQTGCTNKVNTLAAELSAEIKTIQDSKEGISISSLQTKFLPKIEAAEGECDSQFNELMNNAAAAYQEKGLSLQDVEGWKSQYQTAKRNAQTQALSSLMETLSK
jgi:hypothetical protein